MQRAGRAAIAALRGAGSVADSVPDPRVTERCQAGAGAVKEGSGRRRGGGAEEAKWGMEGRQVRGGSL